MMPSRSNAESHGNGDAGRASRSEVAHSAHGYLSTSLDLRGTLSNKPDSLDHRKGLALEMDGEWFGDAQESPSLAAQKQHREPDSPAMTLLRSITKASADAIPGLSAPPLPWEGHRSRVRPREQYSHPAGIGGTAAGGCGGRGGDGSRGSPPSPGDFYRLPWYRRPLPSPRPSGPAAALDLRRRHSMLSAPRSGLRPPSTSVEGLLSGGAGAARGRTAARDPPRPVPGQQPPVHEPPGGQGPGNQALPDGGFVAPMSRARGAAAKVPKPPPNVAPTVPPPQRFAAAAATAAATIAVTAAEAAAASEMAVTAQSLEEETVGGVGLVAGGATNVARSMPGDRGVVEERPSANAGVGVAVREVSCGEDSGEIRRLKAELDRLKREMAAMAAATAAVTTPQPGPVPGCEFGPPRIEVTTPVDAEGRSAWHWADGKPVGLIERPQSTRQLGRTVRADDSWMQRRHSGRYHHRRSSSESLTNGFVGGVIAGSVLPTPSSDRGSRGGPLSFSNRSGHDHHHPAVEPLSPPPHSLGSVGEGPSPASGEKAEGAAAAAAKRRAGGRGSSAGGDRGSQCSSARSSASVRPFSVFFPVQASRRGRAETLGPAPTGVPRDGSAAVPEAAGAVETAAATAEEEDAVAKPVSSDLDGLVACTGGTVQRDDGDGGDGGDGDDGGGGYGSRAEAGVYGKVPAVASPAAVQSGRRRERPSVGRGARVWRWVLAQRTGNQTVRQALMTHGLPPLDRRHIWAAWAAVARPEGATGRWVGEASDPAAQGSVASIIVHDVQRTKILHPLFSSAGPGMAMLKRVLLRCADLGAVKDAGYIQGMNYLAGFLLITFADCVAAERGVSPLPAGGGTGGTSRDPAALTATGDGGGGAGVSLQPELPPAIGREGVAGGEGHGEAEAQPTAADVELIEREVVEVMLGIIALQGGVLSRDLWGLHANTELVETLLSKHCPNIMEHLKTVSLELIVLTPRWFICIYAGSMASQPVVSRIWDLFTWYGRRGPAVLVWVALGVLHGCRARIFESRSLPTAVKAVRRHAEGCKSFDELVRQAPVDLNQVVAAWEEQGENRLIASMDGDGAVPDKMVAGLVREMTGEQMLPHPMEDSSLQGHRHSASGYAPSTSTPSGFGIQFPSTPGRSPLPLSSPRSPFPDWAASIFRSSTGGGGGLDAEGFSAERGDGDRPPASPRFDSTPARSRQLRRAASTSWW